MKKTIALMLVLLLALSAFAFAEIPASFIGGELAKPGQTAEELAAAVSAKGNNETQYFYYDNFASMLLALRAGQIHGAAVPECVAKYVCDRNPFLHRPPTFFAKHRSVCAKKMVE